MDLNGRQPLGLSVHLPNVAVLNKVPFPPLCLLLVLNWLVEDSFLSLACWGDCQGPDLNLSNKTTGGLAAGEPGLGCRRTPNCSEELAGQGEQGPDTSSASC